MSLSFAKYEGIGNDFIVLDGLEVSPELAVKLCDRHLGIGADGVLMLSERAGSYAMRVINADGSEPEMCGNGIRCVALHLARTGRASTAAITIETAAGPHPCRVMLAADRREAQVEVRMRHASLAPAEIGLMQAEPLIDGELEPHRLRVTAVSMGNPHAVSFDDVGDARLELGPLLGRHRCFARGANVGFARMTGPSSMALRVFERGAGWTLACGTGACAAAVAAIETGRAPRGEPIEVCLPGGMLRIVAGELGTAIRMLGPARHVFDGVIDPK